MLSTHFYVRSKAARTAVKLEWHRERERERYLVNYIVYHFLPGVHVLFSPVLGVRRWGYIFQDTTDRYTWRLGNTLTSDGGETKSLTLQGNFAANCTRECLDLKARWARPPAREIKKTPRHSPPKRSTLQNPRASIGYQPLAKLDSAPQG